MTQTINGDALRSGDIPAMEREIEELTAQLAASIKKVREYRAMEDRASSVSYAQEIFTLSQDKLRLQVEIELRQKKIRRIQLGISDEQMYDTGNSPF